MRTSSLVINSSFCSQWFEKPVADVEEAGYGFAYKPPYALNQPAQLTQLITYNLTARELLQMASRAMTGLEKHIASLARQKRLGGRPDLAIVIRLKSQQHML